MKGVTILASLLMQGFFNVQVNKGNLTRDHYLNSPPTEPSLKEFSHTRKIQRWSSRDSNPRLRASTQLTEPPNHHAFVVHIRDVHKSNQCTHAKKLFKVRE